MKLVSAQVKMFRNILDTEVAIRATFGIGSFAAIPFLPVAKDDTSRSVRNTLSATSAIECAVLVRAGGWLWRYAVCCDPGKEQCANRANDLGSDATRSETALYG